MKVRIIESKHCDSCKSYLEQIQKIKHYPDYELYSADVPEHQEQLDKWMITDMPVVQIIDDNGEKLHQFLPGQMSARAILIMMAKIERTKQ